MEYVEAFSTYSDTTMTGNRSSFIKIPWFSNNLCGYTASWILTLPTDKTRSNLWGLSRLVNFY